MTKSEVPSCPNCKAPLVLTPAATDERPRKFKCLTCEQLDPLKSEEAWRWSQALRPPE